MDAFVESASSRRHTERVKVIGIYYKTIGRSLTRFYRNNDLDARLSRDRLSVARNNEILITVCVKNELTVDRRGTRSVDRRSRYDLLIFLISTGSKRPEGKVVAYDMVGRAQDEFRITKRWNKIRRSRVARSPWL